MIKYFFYISTCLAANPFDSWVDHNKDIIKETIKSVSFQIKFESGLDAKEDNIFKGQIIVGKKKQFRFEMGPRTVVSDGILWRSYDERTDQIFIQEPDKKLERALFSWVKVKKLKALPVKSKPDGSCKIKLFGTNNDVQAYFNSDTNVLDSIVISPKNSFRSKIFNISIAVADSVILNIGTEYSDLFDLR
tara:strand:+ start:110 stop:679 length:570 start_codon:yes stop_codon:yes gene_type:complete